MSTEHGGGGVVRSTGQLRDWLVQQVASQVGLEARAVGITEPFFSLGVGSVFATKLIAELARWLDRPLSPTLVWEHPTIDKLARHLSGREVPQADVHAPRFEAPVDAAEPIAIVGLSCRFPHAPDAEAFWRVLQEGHDCVTEVPSDRWDAGLYYDPTPGTPGKIVTRYGAFLDSVDRFDPAFFGISPREAGQLDPQQRLMLELSWEALEDAGIAPRVLRGSRTGVFTGMVWRDYADLQTIHNAAPTLHTCTGHAGGIVANRISYALGLEGPSLAIDTACSSSLVAIHEACRSLRAGESTLALAGGVQLNLSPRTFMAVSAFGALAPDGRCRTFDARASGYVRGEGGGVLVLKPLSKALADGDAIYCLIRGSAVNNDGASNGLTAPNPKAQERLLRDAYAVAGIDPAQVHYVELHGTGTPLGDPIEAGALGMVLGAAREAERPLRVGSVKTNIGHLEAAAGIASVIKVALSIRHQQLPASLHFEQPNPRIPFDDLRLRVQTQLAPWPAGKEPSVAGISAFGFGGTNCHVVVEEHRSGPRKAVVPVSTPHTQAPRTPKTAFLFAGAGSAWWGMGRELLGAEPVFRARFEECDAAFQPLGGWSLVEALLAPRARSRFDQGERQLPLVLAFQISLSALWRSWGVEPSATVGYSVGEWAAAQVAGILTLEEVFALAHHYIQVQKSVAGGVGMAVVGLSGAEVAERIAPYGGRISIASENGPRSTGLGGEAAALQEFTASMTAAGIFARLVEIDFYAHIPQVEALKPLFLQSCPVLRPSPGRIPMVSTVSGAFVEGGMLGPAYWADNFRQPVRFASAVKTLLDGGYDVFLDVNPHPIHEHSVLENVRAGTARAELVASMRRGEPSVEGLHRALAQLAQAGSPVRWERAVPGTDAGLSSSARAELFVTSARTEQALREQADRTAGQLRRDAFALLTDLCYTAGARRSHHEHRLALVAETRSALEEGLAAFARGEIRQNPSQGLVRSGEVPRIGFVFSGQGSFPLGSSVQLFEEEPRFRQAFERCEQVFRAQTGASLIEALKAEQEGQHPPRTEIEQPLLFAFQVALAALWESWGIRPDAVVGHSVGEISAAHLAGVLSLEEAISLVVSRSRLMGRAAGQGGMATVEASPARIEPLLGKYGDELSIAAVNGPENVVVSGGLAALAALRDELTGQGLRVRLLNVNYAFHSAQMAPYLGELDTVLQELKPKPSRLPIYSTVRGGMASPSDFGADHWRANVRERVLFAPAVEAMLADGVGIFVEISPHPVLLQPLSRTLEASSAGGAVALFSTRRDRAPRAALLGSLGTLYTLGHEPSWKGVFPEGGRAVELPSYPWQRQRCWFDAAPLSVADPAHPLLGRRVDSPPGQTVFEATFRSDRLQLLSDHRLYGTVVVAGASMLGMMLVAAKQLWGEEPCALQDVLFLQPLVLGDTEDRLVQVSIATDGAFRILSRAVQGSEGTPRWIEHATGRLERGGAEEAEAGREVISEVEARCQPLASAERFYEGIARQGLDLGRQFRWLEALWQGEREAFGRLRAPETGDGAEDYRFHPGLIDSCFQVLGAVAGFASIEGLAFVPIGVGRFALRGEMRPPRFCHLMLRSGSGKANEASSVDLRLLDESGLMVAEVSGLVIRRAPREVMLRRDVTAPSLVLRTEWQPQVLPAVSQVEPAAWLLLADRGGLAARLAEQLTSRGSRVEVLSAEESAQTLLGRLEAFEAASSVCTGIVDLRGLDGGPSFDAVHGAVKLVQQMAARSAAAALRLVLVTRGAQATGSHDGPIAFEQAPLWGLGNVIALEHPELRCERIDLDPSADAVDVTQLAAELAVSGREDRLAFRAGRRLVARLARTKLPPAVRALPLEGEATYLIVGGLGGIGLELARWMVERGARHLVLMGRSAPGPRAQETLAALKEAGAEISVAMGNVAEREDLARVLGEIRAAMPPLRGVMHAAGVLDDGLLVRQSEERLSLVLAPKILGAMNLHQETLESRLDFFVLFSSVSSVFGTSGQAGYASANAFLDGLAHHRRAQGLPALSINWGPWADVGMAARLPPEAGKAWSSFGLGLLAPSAGFAALERLLCSEAAQVVVAGASETEVKGDFAPFFDVLVSKKPEPTRAASMGGALEGASPREIRTRLLALLQTQAATVLGLSPSSPVDPRRPLQELGLDSLMALQFRNSLAASLGRALPATLLFDHPTLEKLFEFLTRDLAAVSKAAPVRSRRSAKPSVAGTEGAEPIAVVGMACRLPGSVRSPEDFWRLLANGVNAVREVPKDRWSLDTWYDPDPEAPGKMYSRHGGFLDEVDPFDASFFGISAPEARSMDPQQRILLELGWEALESAGIAVDQLKGSPTGVFLGICLSDYALLELNSPDPTGINAYSGSGGVLSVAAGRIAYALGLEGPTLAVDTACSSSLVAAHLACQSLRNGECELALVGGSNLLLSPRMSVYFSKLKALAPDGACKAFDSSANGYVRGEGAGVLVLKRLSDAMADGDPILSVMRGTAVNQDGRSNGLTAPSRAAQERVIESALRQGGLSPLDVSYVEAHGTGTSLGDPIEVQALAAVLGKGRSRSAPLGIGSVKTNVGHLEGAAGVTSLIKAILALRHRELPRSLHFKTPSPHIPWDELPVEVISEHRPWVVPEGKRRILGVSSFGFSGTNAHVILEEAPEAAPRSEALSIPERPELLVLSARAPQALQEAAMRFSAQLSGRAGGDAGTLHDVCYSANCRRSHHEHRLAVVARSRSEAAEALDAFLRGLAHPDAQSGYALPGAVPRVVFLFTGQGGQWPGTGRALLEEEPVFRSALQAADEVLKGLAGWSIIEELQRETPRFDQAAISQPAHFALQSALLALLRSWGIEPDAVAGSSIGEVAAAYAAGILTLEDAMRITVARSRILHAVAGKGAMALVELSEEEATTEVAGYAQRLSVAAINSQNSTLLSGEASAMDELLGTLTARGVSCRRIGLDYASHSPAVEPYIDELKQALQGLHPQPAALPIFSTVTGRLAEEGDFNSDYWARNLRQPVRLAPVLTTLAREDYTLFVELGPNAVMARPVQQCFQSVGKSATVLSTLRRGESERHTLRSLLGGLFVAGVAPAWNRLFPEGGSLVPLPSYSWQKERYWIASPASARLQLPAPSQGVLHGRRVRSPLAESLFETDLSVEKMPFLREHLLHGSLVVAGAAHVALALSALRELRGTAPVRLADIVFPRPLVLKEGSENPVSVVVGREQGGRSALRIQSPQGSEAEWVTHAEGWVLPASSKVEEPAQVALEVLRARCPNGLEVSPVYKAMDSEGIGLGRRFQWVEQLWQGEGEALGRMRAAESADQHPSAPLHPGLIDSIFHVLRAVPGIGRGDGIPYIPIGIEGLCFLAPPRGVLWAHVKLRPEGSRDGETLSADFRLFEESGKTVAWIDGLIVKRAPREAFQRDETRNLSEKLFQVRWQSVPMAPAVPERGPWLLIADRGATGTELATRLKDQGQVCHVLAAPEPESDEVFLQRVEEALAVEAYRGVVYLSALAVEPESPQGTSQAVLEGVSRAVQVLQAIAKMERGTTRLWLVTRGAQAVEGSPRPMALAQAPLWGLGLAVRDEHPELRCTLIDLDPDPAVDGVSCLVQEILTPDREDRLAWRGSARLAQRLSFLDAVPETGSAPISSDGTYLITGGLGGIGLRCARWLVDAGARNLALLGRSGPSDEARAVLGALEAEGVTVRLLQADVAVREEVSEALAALRADMPPLRGVLHAAGLLDDTLLIRQDRDRIQRVLRPKVAGTLNLDLETRGDPLDFFVMFSSIAAMVGGEGQANYSAANAFLDALAFTRRAQGLPAQSLAWGPWAEVGMVAARSERSAHLAALGVESILPDEGVAILGRLLSAASAHVGIFQIDWTRWPQRHAEGHAPLLAGILKQATAPSQDTSEGAPDIQELIRATPEERRKRAEAFLRREVTQILDLPRPLADGRLPLVRFGFDSLMSLKLKARLESTLGLSISAAKLLSGLSLDKLVDLVLERIETLQPAPVSTDDQMEDFRF
ncbi:SDR family NAD(P)-dependent oxidoreductase [Stigmatella sp. ncwal1]|uniref:SDR family NAD(P)-dependent oxidoreductase n=1 Tax=Stigmatella ashevillensis TaxID=2995309 RepID=A0ABT5D021_9BACT|nr:type I polyketide synthase [Stigmatella ashevillena]MDC0707025.1 SDR family NAD(P)-dependent oxidoreductase [Stigmatella ashevillena]